MARLGHCFARHTYITNVGEIPSKSLGVIRELAYEKYASDSWDMIELLMVNRSISKTLGRTLKYSLALGVHAATERDVVAVQQPWRPRYSMLTERLP